VPVLDRKKHRLYVRWSDTENKRYLDFVVREQDKFRTEYRRRTSKVFKLLAEAVQTRDQDQCKSHHQKLMRIHKSL
jgi:hypothetical protein